MRAASGLVNARERTSAIVSASIQWMNAGAQCSPRAHTAPMWNTFWASVQISSGGVNWNSSRHFTYPACLSLRVQPFDLGGGWRLRAVAGAGVPEQLDGDDPRQGDDNVLLDEVAHAPVD